MNIDIILPGISSFEDWRAGERRLDCDELLLDHIATASDLLRENRLLETVPESDLHWDD